MFENMFKKNSIAKIARILPPALVEAFDKHDLYSAEEVKNVFESKFKYEHNVEYALAMFCSQPDFEELNFDSSYHDLRVDIAKECFGSWTRFNFDSLLAYSQSSGAGSFTGGDGGGCGDGGC